MARLLVKPCYCFGAPDIKERLLEGVELNGRSYKNDGYNLLDYLSGKTDTPPRNAFIYVNDAAEVIAIRVGDWKAVYHENRARQFDWGARTVRPPARAAALQLAARSVRARPGELEHLSRLAD